MTNINYEEMTDHELRLAAAEEIMQAIAPKEWEVAIWPTDEHYVLGQLDKADAKRLVALVMKVIDEVYDAETEKMADELKKLAAIITKDPNAV